MTSNPSAVGRHDSRNTEMPRTGPGMVSPPRMRYRRKGLSDTQVSGRDGARYSGAVCPCTLALLKSRTSSAKAKDLNFTPEAYRLMVPLLHRLEQADHARVRAQATECVG